MTEEILEAFGDTVEISKTYLFSIFQIFGPFQAR